MDTILFIQPKIGNTCIYGACLLETQEPIAVHRFTFQKKSIYIYICFLNCGHMQKKETPYESFSEHFLTVSVELTAMMQSLIETPESCAALPSITSLTATTSNIISPF